MFRKSVDLCTVDKFQNYICSGEASFTRNRNRRSQVIVTFKCRKINPILFIKKSVLILIFISSALLILKSKNVLRAGISFIIRFCYFCASSSILCIIMYYQGTEYETELLPWFIKSIILER